MSLLSQFYHRAATSACYTLRQLRCAREEIEIRFDLRNEY